MRRDNHYLGGIGGGKGAMVNSSPAVAAHAEGEEIEVLESTDVLPVAPEDVSDHVQIHDLCC